MSVPAAGKKYFNLTKSPAYAAAARGEIPTIRIGGRIYALPAVIERQLGLQSDKGDDAA
jgi:hypothetical protein